MEKIFDIAKDSEQKWGTLAAAIDGNFEEIFSKVDKITGIEAQAIDLNLYDYRSGLITRSDLVFRTNGNYGLTKHKVIPVVAGRNLMITPIDTAHGASVLPVKDCDFVSGSIVNACDGYTSIETHYFPFEIVLPSDCNYLYVYCANSSGVSYEPTNIEYKSEFGLINGKVDKQQGINNAGKFLRVGPDGLVTLDEDIQSEDIKTCIRRKVSKKLYLGDNLISSIVGNGDNWQYTEGVYTHAIGNTDTLIFDHATIEGEKYVAIFNYSKVGTYEKDVCVSIGEGGLCDIYNGTLGKFYVGMISDGGSLKITASSAYDGSVYGVELRKIVSEDEASIEVELDSDSNKHYENVEGGTMTDNITGWWNIAIGATDALAKNQNGSRNIAIGQRSLSSLKYGARNIGIGTFPLTRLIEGDRNIAIGSDAAWYIPKGEDNVAIGKAALGEVRGQGERNVAIGTNALGQTNSNDFVDNVAIGHRTLSGGSAHFAKSKCVAVGASAGVRNNTKCVAVGANAALYIEGEGNVAIGMDAMNNYDVDGKNNICIGHLAKLHSDSTPAVIENSIVIGYNVKASDSNQIIIGSSSHTVVEIAGKRIIFNEDGSVTWEQV